MQPGTLLCANCTAVAARLLAMGTPAGQAPLQCLRGLQTSCSSIPQLSNGIRAVHEKLIQQHEPDIQHKHSSQQYNGTAAGPGARQQQQQQWQQQRQQQWQLSAGVSLPSRPRMPACQAAAGATMDRPQQLHTSTPCSRDNVKGQSSSGQSKARGLGWLADSDVDEEDVRQLDEAEEGEELISEAGSRRVLDPEWVADGALATSSHEAPGYEDGGDEYDVRLDTFDDDFDEGFAWEDDEGVVDHLQPGSNGVKANHKT